MAKVCGHEVARQTGDVDPHVEDVEGTFDELAVIGVELPEQGRDVRLEESVAESNHAEARVEQNLALGESEHEVARSQRERADQDGFAQAQYSFGEHGAEEGGHVDQRDEGADDAADALLVQTVAALGRVHEEQGQDAEHGVEAEAFPVLDAEEPLQGPWMPFSLCHSTPPQVITQRTLCHTHGKLYKLTASNFFVK